MAGYLLLFFFAGLLGFAAYAFYRQWLASAEDRAAARALTSDREDEGGASMMWFARLLGIGVVAFLLIGIVSAIQESAWHADDGALAAMAASGAEGWQVREDVSDFADTISIYATVSSSRLHYDRFGRSQDVFLMVRCQENKTDLIINWSEYLGLEQTQVRTRIDEKPPVARPWSISTNHQATFAPNPIARLREMKGSRRFLAETVPYGENPVTAEFDVSGIDDVIARVSKGCHWTP